MKNTAVKLYFQGLAATCTADVLNAIKESANSQSTVESNVVDILGEEESESISDLYAKIDEVKLDKKFNINTQTCFNTFANELYCMAENTDCKIKCDAGVACDKDIVCGSSECKKKAGTKTRYCTSGASAASLIAVAVIVIAAVAGLF
eukprot:UN02242